MPMGTIRQVLGKGVRAGIYPISDTEVSFCKTQHLPMQTATKAFRPARLDSRIVPE